MEAVGEDRCEPREKEEDMSNRRAMQKPIAAIAILSLMAFPSSGAGAKSQHRAKRHGHHSHYAARVPGYRQTEGWYEHIADHLPIGSQMWWEQMVREGRGGNPRR